MSVSSPSISSPSVRTLLESLPSRGRLIELARHFGGFVPQLGAKVLPPEAEGLGTRASLDPPRRFAAYFHALKWSSVTATRADLFQAPFRAGIKLLDHQLTPLKKALELPRARGNGSTLWMREGS